jgi:hypothetical protein
MTTQERVQAVADYGFTERQARFLVLVMRHGGLCVKRQYAAFAGIAPGGEKCNAFFDKLVQRGYAVSSDCIHNRARLYHVHHKPLYHAIGEPESCHRRRVPARRAAERLMRLDAVLTSPHLDWLTTRSEKVTYLAARTSPEIIEQGAEATTPKAPDIVSEFPGTFPIGVDAAGALLLVYLVTVPWTEDFRLFLPGHIRLLSVTPAWTLRLVFPQALQRVVPDYQRAVHEELESPLPAATINDLRWYFFHRRRGTDVGAMSGPLRDRFTQCANVFAGPRFGLLYRRWLRDEDAPFTPLSSRVTEAFGSRRASLECIVLPHTYEHLSPLVNHRRRRRRHDTDDAKEGARAFRSLNPSLNPAP